MTLRKLTVLLWEQVTIIPSIRKENCATLLWNRENCCICYCVKEHMNSLVLCLHVLRSTHRHVENYIKQSINLANYPFWGIGCQQEISRHLGPGPFSPAVSRCNPFSSYPHKDLGAMCSLAFLCFSFPDNSKSKPVWWCWRPVFWVCVANPPPASFQNLNFHWRPFCFLPQVFVADGVCVYIIYFCQGGMWWLLLVGVRRSLVYSLMFDDYKIYLECENGFRLNFHCVSKSKYNLGY